MGGSSSWADWCIHKQIYSIADVVVHVKLTTIYKYKLTEYIYLYMIKQNNKLHVI
jgi:hypothetical protein